MDDVEMTPDSFDPSQGYPRLTLVQAPGEETQMRVEGTGWQGALALLVSAHATVYQQAMAEAQQIVAGEIAMARKEAGRARAGLAARAALATQTTAGAVPRPRGFRGFRSQ